MSSLAVLLFAVVVFLCNGIDSATTIDIHSVKYDGVITTSFHVTCKVHDLCPNMILAIQVSRNGHRELLTLQDQSEVSYNRYLRRNIEAEGRIDEKSCEGRLTATFSKVLKEDNGLYSCTVVYVDVEGYILRETASQNFNVEDQDSKDMVLYLMETLVSMETTIQNQQTQLETTLRNQQNHNQTTLQNQQTQLETTLQNQQTQMEMTLQNHQTQFETTLQNQQAQMDKIRKQQTQLETIIQNHQSKIETTLQNQQTQMETTLQNQQTQLEMTLQNQQNTLVTRLQNIQNQLEAIVTRQTQVETIKNQQTQIETTLQNQQTQLETTIHNQQTQMELQENRMSELDDKTTRYIEKDGRKSAFLAGYDNNKAALSTGKILKFTKVIENIGGDYNVTSGVYTAPVDGLYAFHLYALITGSGKKNVLIDILANYQTVGRLWASHTDRHEQSSVSAAVNLKAGDVVKCRVYYISGAAHFHNFPLSGFTGHLITAL